jgi:hypothetical protein
MQIQLRKFIQKCKDTVKGELNGGHHGGRTAAVNCKYLTTLAKDDNQEICGTPFHRHCSTGKTAKESKKKSAEPKKSMKDLNRQ